ncbi:hypothetical protein NHH88_09770 [Oxalobacteraceae bacterium OTU3CAMAD1]|jgi:hypothetical protein|nr:hypothetical protein NHH88_09770 [Oxalobacteraceae bacterium OTU3CAMAD1]
MADYGVPPNPPYVIIDGADAGLNTGARGRTECRDRPYDIMPASNITSGSN